MDFLLETHMHTSESSACGKLTGAEQVRQYKKAGYDGILITDHFINGNSAVDRSLPWKQMMKDQFAGFRKAKKEGDFIGLKVFCGVEFAYHGTEWLIIGLNEAWFINHPEIMDMEPEEFLPFFRNEGAAVIHAHPYREASYIEEIRLYPDIVDAVEVYNYRNQAEWNKKAIEYAKKHNLPMTAGSDCHMENEIGAGIILSKEPESEAELASIIKSGEGYKVYTRFLELGV